MDFFYNLMTANNQYKIHFSSKNFFLKKSLFTQWNMYISAEEE